MADWRVYCEDFRETLAAVEGEADLIATSPPYPSNARTCYGSLDWQDYQALGDAVFAALKPGAHCLLNISAPVRQLRDGHGTERDLLPFRLLLDWADRVGLTVPDTLVFGRMGLPGASPCGFRNDWEPLLWFRRPGNALPIFKSRVKLKAAPLTKGGAKSRRNQDGSLSKQGDWRSSMPALVDRGNRWEYGPVGGGQTGDLDLEAQNHPARWPYRLAADIVACFSDVGDLVVDPFLGGGTTLCAACDGERRFVGGDLAEEWAGKSRELAERRYSQMRLPVGAVV